MDRISVQQLFSRVSEQLGFRLVSASLESRTPVTDCDVWRPGLMLAGFGRGFRANRVQIMGESEIAFLDSLDAKERRASLERLCSEAVPCIIVADGLESPIELIELADEHSIPVIATGMPSSTLVHDLVSYLDDLLAPQTTVHGTLVDVYGVGLLFTGKSGIGKSECGLDLVEKGHRLVADDVVTVVRTPQGHLVGSGSELLRHYMEIRGVGIIDVRAMFGIRGIRQHKRIEVEVRLTEWSEIADYERLGIEDVRTEVLGIAIPLVTLPLVPGKNITVISEVIALNHRLKLYGVHPAREFDRCLKDLVSRKAEAEKVLRGDDE
jgi:HPr kinase/phosphorylase